jgi:hypothetical protein
MNSALPSKRLIRDKHPLPAAADRFFASPIRFSSTVGRLLSTSTRLRLINFSA